MNYKGSYRHLLKNSTAALLAAVEIYNKPNFSYREECFVILLLNSWELLLKAIISKSGNSIFYKKKRSEPYRTFSWSDAYKRASASFPASVGSLAVQRNLELLATYRDNAVHFYNNRSFGVLIYSLAQTSIINFRDLASSLFDYDIGNDMNWQLLPLGKEAPIDPIEFISGASKSPEKSAIAQFVVELSKATKEIETAKGDTGRLLTVFTVKLESTKKISDADVVVGVTKGNQDGPLAVVKVSDPNHTHPLRQNDAVKLVNEKSSQKISAYIFQAVIWEKRIKEQSQYAWQSEKLKYTFYSHDLVTLVSRMTEADLDKAVEGYREFVRGKSKQKRLGKKK